LGFRGQLFGEGFMRLLCALALMQPAAGLTDEDYGNLRLQLRLKSKAWACVPWTASITEARLAALREQKPIFMMVDTGNPIGFA
jgi:hypothetical protein